MSDYLICTRNISKGKFGNEPGKTCWLKVPETASAYLPEHRVSLSDFLNEVLNEQQENIVVFVHGYNTSETEVMGRHRELKSGLGRMGFKGDIITFAWPSGSNALLYLEDRHDAKNTAMELVNSCINLVAKQQGKGCKINLHIIAHSTGAYIVQEAFSDAETTKSTAEVNWNISQILFISGDVSSDSMGSAESLYRHTTRLTNYFNPFDSILSISNVKRVGAKNRAGRVGLPTEAPSKAVDVDCGNYYNTNKSKLKVTNGAHSHSWYFYSEEWMKDACYTLAGEMDRWVIPTRGQDAEGNMVLK